MGTADNNRQLKITVDKEIASAFKAACTTANVSMATVLTQFMTDYSNTAKTRKKQAAPDYSSRQRRRVATHAIIRQLSQIKSFEEEYMDKIPEQFTQRYEEAEHACNQLTEAIDCLEEVF